MRYAIPVVVLGVGSIIGAILLAPTPDAVTMLYALVFLLGLSGLGFWLGHRAARSDLGSKRRDLP